MRLNFIRMNRFEWQWVQKGGKQTAAKNIKSARLGVNVFTGTQTHAHLGRQAYSSNQRKTDLMHAMFVFEQAISKAVVVVLVAPAAVAVLVFVHMVVSVQY